VSCFIINSSANCKFFSSLISAKFIISSFFIASNIDFFSSNIAKSFSFSASNSFIFVCSSSFIFSASVSFDILIASSLDSLLIFLSIKAISSCVTFKFSCISTFFILHSSV
jgi:hypothetical protein